MNEERLCYLRCRTIMNGRADITLFDLIWFVNLMMTTENERLKKIIERIL